MKLYINTHQPNACNYTTFPSSQNKEYGGFRKWGKAQSHPFISILCSDLPTINHLAIGVPPLMETSIRIHPTHPPIFHDLPPASQGRATKKGPGPAGRDFSAKATQFFRSCAGPRGRSGGATAAENHPAALWRSGNT